jgi:SAM-dependent methyltransferase
MFERTISPDDLTRLKAQREEADRLYNEALTALDGAQIRVPDLPHPPPALDEHQITPLNQSWEILNGGGPRPASGLRGRLTKGLTDRIWRTVFPFFERQQAFNARLVDHLNRNVGVERATREAIASTLQMLSDQLHALARFQSHLIVFIQQVTPYVDSKDYESAGLGRRVNEDTREVLDIIDHRTVGLGGAISGVSDELLKRWESMVAREHRYDAKVTALNAAHEELRSTIAIVQQASLTLKREFERLRAIAPAAPTATKGVDRTQGVPSPIATSAAASPSATSDQTSSHPEGVAGTPGVSPPLATSAAANSSASSDQTSPHPQGVAGTPGVSPPLATSAAANSSASSDQTSPHPQGVAGTPGVSPPLATSAAASSSASSGPTSHLHSSIDSYKYVGFEDRYRGSQEDIRARLMTYLPLFEGAADVLDIGCGRGEFLDLLRERGVRAQGLDVNHEMVEVCLARGLDVHEGDALGYLQSLPDGALGGLLAAQVVEHLEPGYLMQMLDVAYHKLRPGSRIILETINPACWFAFFSSYIRDITHVRPLHPDTLSYLLTASGFQRVTVRYEAPYPAHEKLQPIAGDGPTAEIFNANVEKLNGLMFTYLDYAAIGERR